MNSKRGITLTSLVIYIVLFTSFTVFVSITSTNMNSRLFNDRGEAINYSNLNKLQQNIENSSTESSDVVLTAGGLVYSNGDKYVYDSSSKVLYKNNGVLCLNVDEFLPLVEEMDGIKKVTIQVTFNKYLNVVTRKIINCVEVM